VKGLMTGGLLGGLPRRCGCFTCSYEAITDI
jgi:hypothetical protein